MQWKSASRVTMVVIPVVIVCGLLVAGSSMLTFGVSAVAQSNNTTTSATPGGKLCSDRTLSGDYGILIEGTILGPNIPLRGVTMQHYDGNGNITQVDHVVIGGTPPTEEWRPSTGSYTVNPDCTGAAVLNLPGGPPLNLHFVVVNNGKQTNQVVDGNAITAVGTRVN
jgi:hypothetical protein